MNAAKPAGERPHGRTGRRERDLLPTHLPVATAGDWRDPEAAVQALYLWAEAKAIGAIGWYLHRKRPKKRASRLLRAAAIVLGSAGALEPVVSTPWLGAGQAQWGYLLLGCAAACIAFDRFFGISTGWMRCMRSAQRLQALLESFQYDWASACALNSPAGSLPGRLALLKGFTESVSEIVNGETAEWSDEFSSSLAQLAAQTSYQEAGRPAGRQRALSNGYEDEPPGEAG